MLTFLRTPSPLQPLQHSLFEEKKVTVWVKRDDLLHPDVSGNKGRKLMYNLSEAQRLGHDTLLTFGGAFSNHIYATAAAGKLLGLRTIGLIRGEPHALLNPTLQFAAEQGMELHYLSRTDYRLKHTPDFQQSLQTRFGRHYLVPEGGSNVLALQGCAELVAEIEQPFDVLCCACGTGGTLAGLLTGLPPTARALGFSALKGGDFLRDDVQNLCNQANHPIVASWEIITAYHFGGYAKATPELLAFRERFEQTFAVPLDLTYTAKMFFGLFDMIRADAFAPHTRLVALHTGGLQANRAGGYRR